MMNLAREQLRPRRGVFATAAEKKEKKGLTTVDIALAGIANVAFGVLNTAWAYPWVFLNASFGIVGAALLQPFNIGPNLVAYIVRKPGIFTLSGLVMGFANMLSGDPNGINCIYWGLCAGLCGEIAFAILGYKKERMFAVIALACVLQIFGTNLTTYFIYGWSETPMGLFIAGALIGILANWVQSGLLAIWVAKALAKTGLLKRFSIGQGV